MPLILSGNVASATAGAYEVANSCRFNDGDSPHMEKEFSAGSATTWTVSVWVKRGTLGANMRIFTYGSDGDPDDRARFLSDDTIEFQCVAGGELTTTRKFRDCSAWYHLVFVYDSTNGTAGNRMRMYVNGTEETVFTTDTNPSSSLACTGANVNGEDANIGRDGYGGGEQYFDGYMAEFVHIDGTIYAASDFGEFDEDSPTIWKPKNVSGLTFGTNGFYLDFEASDNLGNDANGGTDLTESNLAATDQATDTPTLNYCTFNPLDNTYGQGTFSEGNLKIVTDSSLYAVNTSTFHLTKGKWHFEVRVGDSNQKNCIGISGNSGTFSGDSTLAFGDSANEYSYTASGELRYSGSSTGSWGSSFTDGDIIGCSFDLDNNEIFFYKNGTIQNSGSAFSITDPTSTSSGGYFVAGGDFASDNTSTMEYNFGSPTYSISSGNADANGHGSFEYPVKSGHYAINSANLAEFG